VQSFNVWLTDCVTGSLAGFVCGHQLRPVRNGCLAPVAPVEPLRQKAFEIQMSTLPPGMSGPETFSMLFVQAM